MMPILTAANYTQCHDAHHHCCRLYTRSWCPSSLLPNRQKVMMSIVTAAYYTQGHDANRHCCLLHTRSWCPSSLLPTRQKVMMPIVTAAYSTEGHDAHRPCYLTVWMGNSLSECIFPECFKTAKIIRIFKSGDSNLIANYRPISILPFLSKMFEKLICARLDSYLKPNNISCTNQFGLPQKFQYIGWNYRISWLCLFIIR